jgi:hypothetical protein
VRPKTLKVDIVNLEIDLSDRSQLVRLRNELKRYLGVIEYALKESGPADDGQGTLPLPMPAEFSHIRNRVKSTDEKVRKIIDSLPLRFNSSDIFLKFGDEAKMRRGAIKLSIKRAVDDKKIRVLTAGRGRRPTRFERAL